MVNTKILRVMTLMSYVLMEEEKVDNWEPKIVFFDDNNNILKEKSVV